MIRRVLAVLFVGVLTVLGGAATAHADHVPAHSHFLTIPGTGTVQQVGPRVCDNEEILYDAFHNFHENVHVGTPTGTGGLTITRTLC